MPDSHEIKPKIDTINILVNYPLNGIMYDRRRPSNFISFGTLENVAKQYGISYSISGNGIIFNAPKSRMQMFVERLHFAGIRYFEI